MTTLGLPDEFWQDEAEIDEDFTENKHVYSVSQLNSDIRLILEDNFTPVWIEGEISTLRTPASGHCYFTLKDEFSQVKAVLFRRQRQALRYQPQAGDQVLCNGRISLYEPRGEYQVIVSTLELKGMGELWRAFAALKEKLEREGLFQASRKKKIPELPRCLALITSATGAAVQDILQVVRRRFAGVEIIIVPVTVQGERAAGEIVAALEFVNYHWQEQVDTIILARGGGSYEDLMPFNDERVAYAIAAGKIPLISAVGHEIDFTIADFAADVRAPTPSAAAELVIANRSDMVERLHHLRQRLLQIGRHRLIHERRRLEMLSLGLENGAAIVAEKSRLFAELQVRFRTAMLSRLRLMRLNLETCEHQLKQNSPVIRIKSILPEIERQGQRLKQSINYRLAENRQRLSGCSDRLNAGSPLAVLGRGYSVVEKIDDHKVVSRSLDLVVGEKLRLRFNRGEAECQVESIDVGE
ncbi:MAG: exodeoxyribonuclease VII large subunit [Deltaproteobacteria bacterium]|nr:MAG: exodeoxyribonuclease VII large subunit [Deltaproteobacteria bacterium]